MIDKETLYALKNFVENFVKERDWSSPYSPKKYLWHWQ